MFEDDGKGTRTPDDLIILDPAMVEDLVPRLLEAAERLRAEPTLNHADIARFEGRRRRPCRVR